MGELGEMGEMGEMGFCCLFLCLHNRCMAVEVGNTGNPRNMGKVREEEEGDMGEVGGVFSALFLLQHSPWY